MLPTQNVGGGLRVSARLDVLDGRGRLVSSVWRPYDMTLKQCAQIFQLNVAGIAGPLTVTDTSNTGRSVSAGSSITATQIAFGTGTTPAAFTDYTIQTQVASGSPVTATVNGLSSNTFTITASWSNSTGSSVTVSELACYLTIGGHTFAITHDVFTGQAVANGQSGLATLTFTWT